MLSCFATSMLLALPCAGCDSGSMKVYFNFRRQTFCYQIWYFHMAFPDRSSYEDPFKWWASLWKVLLNYSWSSPEVKNKPQLKSPSLVAFEYEPLDFHENTSMSAEFFKAVLRRKSRRRANTARSGHPKSSFHSHKCITKAFSSTKIVSHIVTNYL